MKKKPAKKQKVTLESLSSTVNKHFKDLAGLLSSSVESLALSTANGFREAEERESARFEKVDKKSEDVKRMLNNLTYDTVNRHEFGELKRRVEKIENKYTHYDTKNEQK